MLLYKFEELYQQLRESALSGCVCVCVRSSWGEGEGGCVHGCMHSYTL